MSRYASLRAQVKDYIGAGDALPIDLAVLLLDALNNTETALAACEQLHVADDVIVPSPIPPAENGGVL